MNKLNKEEEMDRLLRTLTNDAAVDDSSIDEIADSPQLWWGVQRQIAAGREAGSVWTHSVIRRWLMFGAPLAAAAVIALAIFVAQPADEPGDITAVDQPSSVTNEPPSKSNVVVDSQVDQPVDIVSTKASSTRVKKAVTPSKKTIVKLTQTAPEKDLPEIKSEFIALSYARNPESGQIVRVKVPSSMMVSLGLVSSVEKPTSLVNAEILVGDDGMTHAIRFIR